MVEPEKKVRKPKKADDEEIYWFGDASLKKRKRRNYGVCISKSRGGCKINPKCEATSSDECEDYESIQPFIPPIDIHYNLNLQIAETLAYGLSGNDNMLLVGPPGCGKSSLVMTIAAITDWELVRFSCSEETRQSQVIGQWIVVGDKMKWVDGYVTDALRNGKILLEDEADFMRPELRGALHPMLESNGTITLQNYHPQSGEPFLEVLDRHPNFRWISTANTTGLGDDSFLYHGTQFMNAAARDRYNVIIPMAYLSVEEETEIVVKKTPLRPDGTLGIDENIARKMAQTAQGIRQLFDQQKVQYTFSMRRLLAWAKYHAFYSSRNPAEAVKLSILSFARDDDAAKLIEIIRLHMGSDFTSGLETITRGSV